MRSLLIRGLVAGLCAGLCAFVFLKVAGESQVGRAISVGQKIEASTGVAPVPGLVSRNVQTTLGLAIGTLVIGVALGGFFAIAFALIHGRVGPSEARASALAIALTGFVVIHLVPSLKYPANPPSIGQPSTIGQRTSLYFLMLAISVLAAAGTVLAQRRLVGRFGTWNATVLAVVGFVALVVVIDFVLPTVDEVPAAFPASTLWRFRAASLGGQLVFWTALGLVFGALTVRVRKPATAI